MRFVSPKATYFFCFAKKGDSRETEWFLLKISSF